MTATLRGLVLLSSFMRIAYCQGVSAITFSKVPVYTGEDVTLTCSLAANEGVILTVSLVAVSETREVGTLFCDPSRGNAFRNSGEDRFAGLSFTAGCEESTVKSPSVVVRASLSWELHYSCTFAVFITGSSTVRNVTSASVRLSVWVMPNVPSLYPSSLVFSETDNLTLECNSSHGKPASAIGFVVEPQTSKNSQRIRGPASVFLWLPGLAKDWHNAKVMCSVENHNFANMTARGIILVNHIAAVGDSVLTVNTYSTSLPLDCSLHIISFPGATYLWSVPLNANNSEWTSFSNPVLTVQQGQLGLFKCTATNNLTGKAEVITFNLISENPLPLAWIIAAAVVVSVIVIIVVLTVLYKRRCFSKVPTRGDRSSTNCNNNGDREENSCHQEMHDSKSPIKPRMLYPEGGRGRDYDGVVKESLIRGAQPADDAECSEHCRLKPQLQAAERRLVIAAEGVVANLKHKTLPTTVLVNYLDHSCSLDGILVQVGQAIPLPAPPSFKSVALLLRRLKVGLSLAEVDRAVLTSRNVTGERGDKLRDFFSRLAGMSLNKRAGDTRIDILNYDGTDAIQLAKALEDLLMVSVTVSSDPFGFSETNSSPHASEHSAVGPDYFNRRNVDEVVYADVGVADGPLRSQPNKDGNQVMYSEIVRNV